MKKVNKNIWDYTQEWGSCTKHGYRARIFVAKYGDEAFGVLHRFAVENISNLREYFPQMGKITLEVREDWSGYNYRISLTSREKAVKIHSAWKCAGWALEILHILED